MNFDFNAPDLTSLFGPGTAYSEDMKDLTFIQNFDGNKNFLGIGLGFSLGSKGSVNVSKISVVNKGIIITKKEFNDIFRLPLSDMDFSMPAFEHREVSNTVNGEKSPKDILFIFGKDTGIEVDKSRTDKNLIVSKNTYYGKQK